MKQITLDAIDVKLLNLLQTDASMSNQALAEQVHISPPTCLRRIKALRDSGLIERQIALLNPDRIVISGPGTAAFDLMEGAMHLAIEEGVVAELRQGITIETIPMNHDMIITGTIQALLHELDRDVFAGA